MKKHHLIFLSTAIFTLLFYDQRIGLNLGILGLVLTALVVITTPKAHCSTRFYALIATSVGSSAAYAYYGDFVSFCAVFLSLSLLVLQSRKPNLKPLICLLLIPVNGITFFFRIFCFREWLPELGTDRRVWKKLFACVLIPTIFSVLFFLIYTLGSKHFENILSIWTWDFNLPALIAIVLSGFFLMFNYWNFQAGKFWDRQNLKLKDCFIKEIDCQKPAFSFMDPETERTSGVISFVLLNVLLLFFIITYNYEQFFENKTVIHNLSAETHEHVNAVILSIVMAIVLIMFYFKSSFNFDPKAERLKTLAVVWIILNVVLVLSAIAKNTEYINRFGMITYKRLGVYAFLGLALTGLFYTFLKIKRQKTNAFLCNRMFWCFFGVLMVCGFVNWGWIITRYNTSCADFDINYHIENVNFNRNLLLEYADSKKDTAEVDKIRREIRENYYGHSSMNNFLSIKLYYEISMISLQKNIERNDYNSIREKIK